MIGENIHNTEPDFLIDDTYQHHTMADNFENMLSNRTSPLSIQRQMTHHSPPLKLKVKYAPGEHMYKSDKQEVHKLQRGVYELQKQLPRVQDVQDLIIKKKQIHNSVILGVNHDKVQISKQLQNLHYSQAGRSPRLSDLGPPKEPKPE
jgi:hypothetical protein